MSKDYEEVTAYTLNAVSDANQAIESKSRLILIVGKEGCLRGPQEVAQLSNECPIPKRRTSAEERRNQTDVR